MDPEATHQNQEDSARESGVAPGLDPGVPTEPEDGKKKKKTGQPPASLKEAAKEFRDYAVAAAAVAALFAMWESNRLTRQSNELTVRAVEISARAEIAVEQVRTETLSPRGEPASTVIVIRNTGGTSATELRVLSCAAYLPSPIQANFPIGDNGKVVGSVGTLAAGSTLEIYVLVEEELTESDFQGVRQGETQLYVFGEITYLNGFERTRRTRFCLQHEGGHRWGQCPNNNEVE